MNDNIKLTGCTQFSGCGAKLGPGLLDQALCGLSQADDPRLLVDFRHSDDAAVWKISDDTAMVQTVDFFPPIADDPFTFGRIAAANALSDVYAMGARPVSALSIVAFPAEQLEIKILTNIMAGALDALKEAGASLAGGHSIKDSELKFGLAVTGLIHPDKVFRNNQLRPGDRLILTKPIGTGCINRALKAGKAAKESVQAAERSMTALNRQAAEILTDFRVSSCTDVTGFGLLGHACEMVSGSGCGLRVRAADVRTLPGAAEAIAQGLVPGGTRSNRSYRERWISNAVNLDDSVLNLLFDPQTSGGLMAAVDAEQADLLISQLNQAGVPAFSFGDVVSGDEQIEVIA